MNTWQKGLTINDQRFTFRELLRFCQQRLGSINTPPWEKAVYQFITTWLSDDDFIVQYSSGTTGESKEIRLSKQSMIASATVTCSFFSLLKAETALLCLPAGYIAGKMMIIRSMVGELNLYLAEPKSLPDISAVPRIDFCAMVPLQVINILNDRKTLQPIKKLIIGGAEISPELATLLLQTKTVVYATYGMAETCSHVALRRLNGPDREEAYQAIPGVTLASDERDCLVIAADYLPDCIITNDLVEFTRPGTFTWLGRYDNLINSGGIKIVPEEMEARICEKTGLTCAVIGLPDKKLGQKPVLVLDSKTVLSISKIKSKLEKLFPRNKLPREIIWVDELPWNDFYKLDRLKISKMISDIQ